MSKKVNPAAVGIFVAGAVIIILTTLVLLGTGRYFEKRGRFVIYFESSANGLEEGSDVLLGGVKVGSVKKMFVQFDPETRAKVIPVVIELSGDRLAALSADSSYTREEILSEESLSRAIEDNGLRARLMTKSVLTGQLYVDLEFFVEKVESYRFPGETVDGLLQIPSTKNEIERVLESIAEGVHELGDIEFAKLIEHVDQLVTNLDDKLGELDLAGISDRTKGTLEKADAAFADFGDALQNENLKSAIANLDEAAEELKNLVVGIDGEAINETIRNTADATGNIDRAAGNIADLTTPDSAIGVRLNRTLASLEEVSRSIKSLADYLKRNPNAIIAGKKRP
jgi:paraquat-inducible protein B